MQSQQPFYPAAWLCGSRKWSFCLFPFFSPWCFPSEHILKAVLATHLQLRGCEGELLYLWLAGRKWAPCYGKRSEFLGGSWGMWWDGRASWESELLPPFSSSVPSVPSGHKIIGCIGRDICIECSPLSLFTTRERIIKVKWFVMGCTATWQTETGECTCLNESHYAIQS